MFTYKRVHYSFIRYKGNITSQNTVHNHEICLFFVLFFVLQEILTLLTFLKIFCKDELESVSDIRGQFEVLIITLFLFFIFLF